MFRYAAYGLVIASEFALPELSGCDTDCVARDPDVSIGVGPVASAPPESAFGGEQGWVSEDAACFHFDEVGVVSIRGGRSITIDRATGDDAIRRLALLGPALAVLLHQRGLLILHASAVAIVQPGHRARRAVAFVGEKGAGKSTTAAALLARGHALICDDIVAVDLSDAMPMVHPGFPHLKLWPEAAASTLNDAREASELPRVHPGLEKRSRRLNDGFASEPLPLGGVFELAFGDCDAIEPLSPQQTFVTLLRHSYLAQLLPAMKGQKPHFDQTIRLAQSTPVRTLIRRRDLTGLGPLAQRIEASVLGVRMEVELGNPH